MQNPSARQRYGGLLCLGLLLLAWLQTAWLSDDAGITLRAVLNFLNGYGPNFNVDERVQVYTHPLWFLLLSAAIGLSGEIYFTVLAISLACLLFAVSLLFASLGSTGSTQRIIALTLLLLSSRAFVDFSSSGLENPMTHLLLALVIWALYRGEGTVTSKLLVMLLAAALLLLNRQDTVLLVAPLIAWRFLSDSAKQRWVPVATIAAMPVLAWFSFSLIYYGQLVPNTAYAKLAAGIDSAELLLQGAYYVSDSFYRDPATLSILALAALVGLRLGSGDDRALLAGVLLYLLYTVWIGGDFMSGRFFSAPLLVAAFVLALRLPTPLLLALPFIAVLPSLVMPKSHLLGGPDYRGLDMNARGIADERGFYFPNTGLISSWPPRISVGLANLDWEYRQLKGAKRFYTLGLAGLQQGPEIHVYDPLGLADPLLSRLPQGFGDAWRPGHYQRREPLGLMESLQSGQNLLQNSGLAAFYDDLRLVTRGPLWSAQRWAAIVRLHRNHHQTDRLFADLSQADFVPERPFHSRD